MYKKVCWKYFYECQNSFSFLQRPIFHHIALHFKKNIENLLIFAVRHRKKFILSMAAIKTELYQFCFDFKADK